MWSSQTRGEGSHVIGALVMGDGVLCYGALEIVGLLLLLNTYLHTHTANMVHFKLRNTSGKSNFKYMFTKNYP